MKAVFSGFAALLLSAPSPATINDAAITGTTLPRTLSEFGFFTGPGATQPDAKLISYSLRTPLFSDYSEKQRFMYLPSRASHYAEGQGLLQMPVGTALIKTFGYSQAGKFIPIETRVLLHRADGWLALPYVWNADLSDAVLKVGGTRVPVTFTDDSGVTRSISYAVPNKNQCKECHALNNAVTPIGPKRRNLVIAAADKEKFAPFGPVHASVTELMPVWNDPASGPLDKRARAYLDVNCGHCHNRAGSASNSGLFLNYDEDDGPNTGLNKRPVAAGRGSGNLEFAISPGHADASIMVYRMASTEPGIAMPEVGRALVHDEGVALIRDWVNAMDDKGVVHE